MLKNAVRRLVQRYGYDFIKTPSFIYGERFKKPSSDPAFDYYETEMGNYYLPKNCPNDIVANFIRSGKLFDEAIYDVAKSYIKPDSLILDIGANYGQMAIEISKIASNTQVWAFEAQKMVFDILRKNIESNNRSNVMAFYNAVYNIDGKEFLFPVPDLSKFSSYGSYGLDVKAKDGIPVKSITIDSLDFTMPVSFIKIDIQGSDLAAMQGAVHTIARYKMPIIFEYEEQFQQDFNTSFQDYVAFVDSIDYKFVKTVQEINYLIVPK
jgi:FkbM family methyltransferase